MDAPFLLDDICFIYSAPESLSLAPVVAKAL
jgi:hypothetical protein